MGCDTDTKVPATRALDGTLDCRGEIIEVVGSGPLLERPQLHQNVGVVGASQVHGDLCSPRHAQGGDHLWKSVQDLLGLQIQILGPGQ